MASVSLLQNAPVAAMTSLILVAGGYLLAGVLFVIFARPLARGLLRRARLVPSYRRLTGEHRRTFEGLIASLIALVAMVLAVVATLALFVPSETLIWILGLFSAAFGLGARGMVADFVAGGSFILRLIALIHERLLAAGITL